MKHQKTDFNLWNKVACTFITACLILGLTPAIALADTTVGVKVEEPLQVNETVALSPEAQTETEAAGAEVLADTQANQEPLNTEVALDPSTTNKPAQITSDVALVASSDTQVETLLVDGLTYLVDYSSNSATLTGWYGTAPSGHLSIPSHVSDSKNTFSVKSAGGGTF